MVQGSGRQHPVDPEPTDEKHAFIDAREGDRVKARALDFFHDNSGIDEPTVQSETDRYMAWPAQALGYKVGQLKLLELRERARRELGPKFDIRGFHDEVLTAGALPLDVLETRVQAWISQVNAAGGSSAPAGR